MKLLACVCLLLCLGTPGLALAQSTAVGADSAPPGKGLGATLERAAQERTRKRNNSRYDNYFRKYSKRYFGLGFDWRYFKAQGMAESELNPNAKSYVGARGIMVNLKREIDVTPLFQQMARSWDEGMLRLRDRLGD